MLIDKLIYEARTELDDLEAWLDEKLSSLSASNSGKEFFTQEHKELRHLAIPVAKLRLIVRLGLRKKTHARMVQDLQHRMNVGLVERLRRVADLADKTGNKAICDDIKSTMSGFASV